MDTRADSRAAQLGLPLATGLLIVALDAVVPAGGAGLLGILILLTLGAVLRGSAWRAGAIAGAPVVVAAVVAAAGESARTALLLLVASPVLVAVFAAAVKGGSMLAAPPTEPRTGGGWRPFETQAQRGRFLVVVAVLLAVGAVGLRSVGAGQADRAAARRAAEIRNALDGQTAATLQGALLAFAYKGADSVPGGPYSTVQPGLDRFIATDEVHKLAQFRCIHVEVDGAGAVSTRVAKDRCRR